MRFNLCLHQKPSKSRHRVTERKESKSLTEHAGVRPFGIFRMSRCAHFPRAFIFTSIKPGTFLSGGAINARKGMGRISQTCPHAWVMLPMTKPSCERGVGGKALESGIDHALRDKFAVRSIV
jgi:hypothetical protein